MLTQVTARVWILVPSQHEMPFENICVQRPCLNVLNGVLQDPPVPPTSSLCVTLCHCTSKVELQLSARLHHQSSIVAGSDHGFAACVLPLLRPMIPNVPQTLGKHRTIYLKIRGKIMFGTSPSSPRAAETVTASAGVMSTSRARVLSTKTALDSIHVIRTEVKLGYTAFPWVTWI